MGGDALSVAPELARARLRVAQTAHALALMAAEVNNDVPALLAASDREGALQAMAEARGWVMASRVVSRLAAELGA
jgi:hypothetical protein